MSGPVLTPEIIGRALDQAPVTKGLLVIVGIAAAGFFFDSFDISIIAYALPSIGKEFALSPQQLGIVGSAGFAGMAVGSWLWGWIADRWGRRLVFALTVLTFSVFTGLAALAFSLGFLIGARFMTGLGLGGTIPVDGALVAEFVPARIRGRSCGILPFSWPLGIFAAAGAGLAIVPTIGWRWLFVLGALPALLTFVIRRGVPESPRWLAARGRSDEARRSLRYVGIDDPMLERAGAEAGAHPAPKSTAPARITELFGRGYARRVVHTWSLWFFSSLAGWAFVVWLPTVYVNVYHIPLPRTLAYTFLIAGVGVVGRFVALWLVDLLGRKAVIVGGYMLAGMAAWSFNVATTEASLLIVAMVFSFFQDQGALAMTVYTPEVYPLRLRALGSSWAMACGRLAGALSPLLVGVLLAANNITLVWWLMGATDVVAAALSVWLALETRGRNLERLTEAVA